MTLLGSNPLCALWPFDSDVDSKMLLKKTLYPNAPIENNEPSSFGVGTQINVQYFKAKVPKLSP